MNKHTNRGISKWTETSQAGGWQVDSRANMKTNRQTDRENGGRSPTPDAFEANKDPIYLRSGLSQG